MLCLIALCSSAVINSAPSAAKILNVADEIFDQDEQVAEIESDDDLSTAESANPEYFCNLFKNLNLF